MSFNIRWDGLDSGTNAWVNRKPIAVEVIRTSAPDVVGLQEPSPAQTRDLDTALDGYVSFQADHERDRHITFLYRSDRFTLAQGGSFWVVERSDLPGGTRRCVWIRLIEKTSDFAFYVFNNHFDHRSSESREQSARALLTGIRNRDFDDPIVVLGDFNEHEDGPAMKLLKGATKPSDRIPPLTKPDTVLVDTFRMIYPERANAASAHGFSGTREGIRVDFILVRPQDEILDAQIIHFNRNGRYPSDHFPVTATVRLVSGS